MGSICPKEKIRLIPKSINLCYTFSKVLGQGCFGIVREGHRKNNSEMRVAIKTIKKDKNIYGQSELEILKKLDHPYVIKLFEAFEDSDAYHLVTELCQNGDLLEKITNSKRLPEAECKIIMKKILLAVNYLHINGVVHRDLKPENFLFQGSEIKLIDFGYAEKFVKTFGPDNSENFMNSLVGTVQYLAPEVLREKYDQKCDMWSIGVILYFMLSGVLPFTASNNKDCFKKILKGDFTFPEQFWTGVSKRGKKFVCQLLKTNPKKRISAKKALKNKWFEEEAVVSVSYSFLFCINNIHHQSEFKKFVVLVLVRHLCSEEIKEITATFLSINKSNSGIIRVSELEKALKRLDPNTESKDLYKFFTEEGKITYSNFVAAAIFTRPVSEPILVRGFKVLSSKKSPFITPGSLRKALAHIGKPISKFKITRLISDIDPELKEKISFHEFKEIFLSSFRSKSH